jgi:hypothetical protein
MALTVGTDCGLVLTAPTGVVSTSSYYNLDGESYAFKVSTGANHITISEVGWYCRDASEESNYQIGLYSHDSSTNRAKDLLQTSGDKAKGTTSGWKVVNGLSWILEPNTTYWLAVQLDNTATSTGLPAYTITGQLSIRDWSATELENPWGSTYSAQAAALAIYGLFTYNEFILVVNNCSIATTVPSISLTQKNILDISNSSISVESSLLSLIQHYTLSVNDCNCSIVSDSLVFTGWFAKNNDDLTLTEVFPSTLNYNNVVSYNGDWVEVN